MAIPSEAQAALDAQRAEAALRAREQKKDEFVNDAAVTSGMLRFTPNGKYRVAALYSTTETPPVLLELNNQLGQGAIRIYESGLLKKVATGFITTDTLSDFSMSLNWGKPTQASDLILGIVDDIFSCISSIGGLSKAPLMEKIQKRFGGENSSQAGQMASYVMQLLASFSFAFSDTKKADAKERQAVINLLSQSLPMYPALAVPKIDQVESAGFKMKFEYGSLGLFDCNKEVVEPLNKIIREVSPALGQDAGSKVGLVSNVTNLTGLNIIDFAGVLNPLGSVFTVKPSHDDTTESLADLKSDLGKAIGEATKLIDPETGQAKKAQTNILQFWRPTEDEIKQSQVGLNKVVKTIMYLPQFLDTELGDKEALGNKFTKYYLAFDNGNIILGPFTIQECSWKYDLKSFDEDGRPKSGEFNIKSLHMLLPYGYIIPQKWVS